MTGFVWPDLRAVLEIFAEYLEDVGEPLELRSGDDLAAGYERARSAADYLPDADAAQLAALVYDGVSTRHALVDGNKRIAWLCMTTFLEMNGVWFDPPDIDAYEAAISSDTRRTDVDALARFIRAHSRASPAPGGGRGE